MPAAAVIPAPIAYTISAVVSTLVVGFRGPFVVAVRSRQRSPFRRRSAGTVRREASTVRRLPVSLGGPVCSLLLRSGSSGRLL